MNNNIWLKMNQNTHQRSEPNSRFKESVQFRQDLQSPSLYSLYSDSCYTFCSYFGSVILVICICVLPWLFLMSFYNMVKAIIIFNANRTLDISLVNFTNNSLLLNESFSNLTLDISLVNFTNNLLPLNESFY